MSGDPRLSLHLATTPAVSHEHLDCPACGTRLYGVTDEIGRSMWECGKCQIRSYLPLHRDPPPPKRFGTQGKKGAG